jgi:hypothetical protein
VHRNPEEGVPRTKTEVAENVWLGRLENALHRILVASDEAELDAQWLLHRVQDTQGFVGQYRQASLRQLAMDVWDFDKEFPGRLAVRLKLGPAGVRTRMKTIYADFNDLADDGTLDLGCAGSVETIAALPEAPQDGAEVWFTDGELRVRAQIVRGEHGWEGRAEYWAFER